MRNGERLIMRASSPCLTKAMFIGLYMATLMSALPTLRPSKYYLEPVTFEQKRETEKQTEETQREEQTEKKGLYVLD